MEYRQETPADMTDLCLDKSILVPGESLFGINGSSVVAKVADDYSVVQEGRVYPDLCTATNACIGEGSPTFPETALRYWYFQTASGALHPLLHRYAKKHQQQSATSDGSETALVANEVYRDGDCSLTMVRCPGLRATDISGLKTMHDLKTDVAQLRQWGTKWVLSVIEPHEYFALGLSQPLGDALYSAGLKHLILPVMKDDVIPTQMYPLWQRLLRIVMDILRAGNRVVIHSGADMGRAGYIAAKLLIAMGFDKAEAISQIRHHSLYAIGSYAQENELLKS